MEVIHNTNAHQFEVHHDKGLSLATYRIRGDQIHFLHTEVPDALEGQGIASQLAKTALEFARAENLKVWPYCPFFEVYIQRHSEYANLVDPAFRK